MFKAPCRGVMLLSLSSFLTPRKKKTASADELAVLSKSFTRPQYENLKPEPKPLHSAFGSVGNASSPQV
jgi:hypothetical protein